MVEVVDQHRAAIADLCRKHGIRRLVLFGSAAAGEGYDGRESDFDFFYEFEAGADRLFDRFFDFKEGLERLLGRPVDLVSLKDVTNPYFLNAARRHQIELYAA